MRRFSLPSISARLSRMNLLVSGSVLIMALAGVLVYDLISYRTDLIENLKSEAQISGYNTISALQFNDPQSATTTLAALRGSPDVRSVVLTDSSGKTFATYGNAQDELRIHPLEAGKLDEVSSSGIEVLVEHRIIFQGKSIGVVYLSARLNEMIHRTQQFLVISLLILLLCMIAAVLISSATRRLIVRPIVALADTAASISRDQDYSIRARVRADTSEMRVLVDAFNKMLKQIQERDAALNEARSVLEQRVQERTAELQAANRDLEAFSYTVAHDLRGPLDAISNMGYLFAQRQYADGDEISGSMLDMFRSSTSNMSALIDDLLNFSRATNAAPRSNLVRLADLVQGIAAELSASEPGRRVKFIIGGSPQVQTDVGLMRIVLANLLRNSWKYTSHHRDACIEFGMMPNGHDGQNGLVYFVRDDGAGFDPRRAQLLFQPFQRLHGKEEFPGTGIGLATVRRILDRLGGSIWAEGAVEKGATFFFTLGDTAAQDKAPQDQREKDV